MTFIQASKRWRSDVLPAVRLAEGLTPDWPRRRQSWVDFIDSLVKGGEVHPNVAARWGHPREARGPYTRNTSHGRD